MTQKPTDEPPSTSYDDIIHRNNQRNRLLKGVAFLGLPLLLLGTYAAVKQDLVSRNPTAKKAPTVDTVQVTKQSPSGHVITYQAVIENKTDTTSLILPYNDSTAKMVDAYTLR